MRQKKMPIARKPAVASDDARCGARKRNAWEPQIIVPHQVDLPLERPDTQQVVVPACTNGRSLANGRL